MSQADLAVHYVCTHQRAQELIRARSRFWVSNCGCRESRGQCGRSRMDVCLIFTPDDPGSGSGKKKVDLADVMDILHEAKVRHLVARPYRNQARTDTDGICFCCDDCCGYFADPSEQCDRGDLVADTDFDLCTHCGDCVDVCYFHARAMSGDELCVETDRCYGCGLCVDVCPAACIRMAQAT
jgi:Pyruvate/2-oxoacid:ferredoxin oxidoreductase delta subunit